MLREFILENIIGPIRYNGFTINKGALFLNLVVAIRGNMEWYFIALSYFIVMMNYLIILAEYKNNKPDLTPTELEIQKRDKKIKKLLSKW